MLVDLMDFSREAVGSLPRRAAPAGAKNSRKRMRIRASEMKKVKARPRIQRAFFTWLIRNRHRLAFDLLIEGRTDRFIEFSFVGINRAISAILNTNEIVVLAELKGECWDLLMDWDSSPACGPTGYFCGSCLDHFRDTNPGEEFTKFFPSREAVWADDIFEPFLRWVNEGLTNAKWLGIYGEWGHATWARLMDVVPEGKAAENLAALLPCREA